jgi:adenylate cyclase
MKYHKKLFISFNLIVFISISISLTIVYTNTYRLVFNQIRSELLSVALTTANSIDVQTLASFDNVASQHTASYHKMVDQLRVIRNSNRRTDFYIKYLYLMRRKGFDRVIYVLDTEEDANLKGFFGELVIPPIPELNDIKDPIIIEKVAGYQQWVTWLSAFIPLYDDQHRMVGILGIDAGAKHTENQLRNLLFYGIIALVGSLITSTFIAYLLSKLTTHSLNILCKRVQAIGKGDFKTHVELNTKDEFHNLAITMNEMADSLAEKERLTSGFSRYVSQHVLDSILKSNSPTKLEGEKRTVTIMFSDIRSFTRISEHLPPEAVVSFLNEYFEKMIAIIFYYHGTLDKFIGDGIMAEFGMPLEDPEQAMNAIRAAAEMQRMVKKLSKEWEQKGYHPVKIGIGIHTGLAIVGNIGSDIRMEYTAVGDTVNVAAGLEGQTKYLSEEIIISKEVYDHVKTTHDFVFKDLGLLYLPERGHPMRAYAVLDKKPNPSMDGL